MDKLKLITRGLEEVLGLEELEKLLNEHDLNVYWGTAPTGQIHFGYFIPMIKIADFLKANSNVTILFANLHAYLDSMKSTLEQLDHRILYYQKIIQEMFKVIGVDISKLTFVTGSDFQLSKEYFMDLLKFNTMISIHDALKGGDMVVKQSKNPKVSSTTYPLMQALDEEYLHCDAQLGGIDQIKIFTLAAEHLPKLGYSKRIHLMNPMLPNFVTPDQKMSSSDPNSKINIIDSEKDIRKKISKAFCEPGNIETNPLLMFVKLVIFPIIEHRDFKSFIIDRSEQYGGKIKYLNYEQVENDFRELEDGKEYKLSPQDLKLGVSDFMIDILRPIRELADTDEFRSIIKNAYE